MGTEFQIGDVTAVPGEIRYGRWDALEHPTGHVEFFPLIVAQGHHAGPCFWLTAGVHGSEQAGPLVLYELLTRELVDHLRGTIVAIPALNPAGLRTRTRDPYHADVDPNRLWPEEKADREDHPDFAPPTSLERAYQRLYEEMTDRADFLIDYHNAWIGSLSFALRDRILYRGDDAEDKDRAQALSDRLDAPDDFRIRAPEGPHPGVYSGTGHRYGPGPGYYQSSLCRHPQCASLGRHAGRPGRGH